MKPCEYPGCSSMGQQHHIVFRSQGGMNIDINYAYLCPAHHTGTKAAVHNNREFDLKLKRNMQEELFRRFTDDEYTIEQVAKIIWTRMSRHARTLWPTTLTTGNII